MRTPRRILIWGRCPQTPGILRFSARMDYFGERVAPAPRPIPAAESALGLRSRSALSSAQVLPEWTTSTSPCNNFLSNGDNPLNSLSHSKGSLHQVATALGITRQAVDKRRTRRALLAVPTGSGEFLYPACQFTAQGVIPGLEAVLLAFRIQNPWTQLSFLLAPTPALRGKLSSEGRRDQEGDWHCRVLWRTGRVSKAHALQVFLAEAAPVDWNKSWNPLDAHPRAHEKCPVVWSCRRQPTDTSFRRPSGPIPRVLSRNYNRCVFRGNVAQESACPHCGTR
jgi:hypothetical protein